MQFHCRRPLALEPTRVVCRQRLLERKGAPVLDHDATKLTKRSPALDTQHPHHPTLEHHAYQLAHELAESPLRQLIVKRLVGYRGAKQCIETALNVGQRLNTHHRAACQQTQRQSIRRDHPFTLTKAHRATQIIQCARRQNSCESAHQGAKVSLSHSSLLLSWCFGDSMIGDFEWDVKKK